MLKPQHQKQLPKMTMSQKLVKQNQVKVMIQKMLDNQSQYSKGMALPSLRKLELEATQKLRYGYDINLNWIVFFLGGWVRN